VPNALIVQTVQIQGSGVTATSVNHSPGLSGNTNNPFSLSGLPSTGSGTGSPFATEMLSIQVTSPVAPSLGSGLIGAYVDIERF